MLYIKQACINKARLKYGETSHIFIMAHEINDPQKTITEIFEARQNNGSCWSIRAVSEAEVIGVVKKIQSKNLAPCGFLVTPPDKLRIGKKRPTEFQRVSGHQYPFYYLSRILQNYRNTPLLSVDDRDARCVQAIADVEYLGYENEYLKTVRCKILD